jgi:hypothetical protein
MSNAKTELFTYLVAAFATLFGLFVLHRGYSGIIDVGYHKRLQEAGQSENVTAARSADQAALQKGKIPIEQAMARLGKGRATIGSVAPQPSSDLSAISGWIYSPKFKPAVAHEIRTPRAAAPQQQAPKATEPPAASMAPPVIAPQAADPAVTSKKPAPPAPAPGAAPAPQPAPAQ